MQTQFCFPGSLVHMVIGSYNFCWSFAGDWVMLAKQLNITDDEIEKIQGEYTYVSEQALVMLHLWVQKNEGNATGMSVFFFLQSSSYTERLLFHCHCFSLRSETF